MSITHSTKAAQCTKAPHRQRVKFSNLSSISFLIIPNSAWVFFWLLLGTSWQIQLKPVELGIDQLQLFNDVHCQIPITPSNTDEANTWEKAMVSGILLAPLQDTAWYLWFSTCPAWLLRHYCPCHMQHDIKLFYLSIDELPLFLSAFSVTNKQ